MNSEAKPIKSKRRWLRFSLRSFLIAMTILLIGLGWFVNRVQQQKAIASWLTKNGGNARFDFEYDWNNFGQGPTQPDVPAWLLSILDVDYFSSVVDVGLEFSPINDLTPLNGLPNLKSLELRSTQVSDLTPLANLKRLETLRLSETQVSDLTPLANLTNLKNLLLSETHITNLTPLANLTSLEFLELSNTQVSDLNPLARLSTLKDLDISSTQVADITPLSNLKKLENLWLIHLQISDEQIEKLKLALPNCKISR